MAGNITLYRRGINEFYAYQLGESYLQKSITVVGLERNQVMGMPLSHQTTPWKTTPGTSTTTNTYDLNGYLVRVSDGKATDRAFANNAQGIVLAMTQGIDSGKWIDQLPSIVNQAYSINIPTRTATQYQFVANGEVLGRYGQMVDKQKTTDPDKPVYKRDANFSFGYQAVGSTYPANTPVTWVVQAGDTLQSIAKAVYGDASQWYLIADANGLSDSSELRQGANLTIPSGVGGANHNSGTFKPYDPSAIVGDTTPVLPMPSGQGGGGCGGLGQIFVVAIAVVVTVFTAGVATGALASGFGATMSAGASILTGTGVGTLAGASSLTIGAVAAGSAAVGSIVSQGVGIGIGVQDSFSWRQVGLSAIGSGVTAGLGNVLQGSTLLNGLTPMQSTMLRAAVSNTISQGIGIATGLQSAFSWKGVAASAVGAGVGEFVAGRLPTDLDPLVGRTLTGLAAGTAAAVMRGGRVVIQQIATDAFGNALGRSLADAMKPSDPLGEFIDRNMPAWEQRQATYDQLVGVFSQPGEAAGVPGAPLADSWARDRSLNRVVSDAGNDMGSALPTGASSGSGLRLPSGYADGWGPSFGATNDAFATDSMGQPLNGRSNYNAASKFGEIVGGFSDDPLGTLGRLADWATYTVPDAQQRRAEINAGLAPDPRYALIDRVAASTLGGSVYGVANLLGASPETQQLALGLASAADGLLTSAAAIKGAVPSFLGAQRPGVMDVQSPYALTSNNYLSGFTRTDKLGMGIRLEANQGLLDYYSAYGGQTATQLYVRAFDGKGGLLPGSVRLDRVGLRADGGFDLIDYKLSTRSPLTANQELHYPALAQHGGLVTGYKGFDIGLPQGRVLPPSPVIVKPGPTLRLDR